LAYDPADQRLQPRQRPLEQPYQLTDQSTGKQHTVRIQNINFAGCELELVNADLSLNEECQQLSLTLAETGHDYHIRIMERDKRVLRCLIIQRELKAADALLNYLNEHLLMVRDDVEEHVDSQLA
jgi:hypothetical protein